MFRLPLCPSDIRSGHTLTDGDLRNRRNPLLIGKKTRTAAAWIGLTVLFVILVEYVPIAVAERDSLGLNYLFDTLMYCGTLLLLAGAMPRSDGPVIPLHRILSDNLVTINLGGPA